MNNPLVSIIIPTFNRAHLIAETLDSVLAQTYENWECIIVDDGSTDNTAEVVGVYIQKDSRFQYHHRPVDRLPGGNAARNYGFELSNGEFIQWFDDDDVMLKCFLKTKMDLFLSEINLVIVSGYFVDSTLEHMEQIYLDEKANLFKEYIRWNLKILTPSILFRKSFLLAKALFSNEILRGQETEFFSRVFFQLPKDSYSIHNKPLFLYRQHSNTKTQNSKVYNKKYKLSESYIALENLKRCIELGDLELVNYFYIVLLDFFFKGIENNHKVMSKEILMKLCSLLKKRDEKLRLELLVCGKIILFFNRSSYRLEKKFRNHKIK